MTTHKKDKFMEYWNANLGIIPASKNQKKQNKVETLFSYCCEAT